MDDFKKIYGYAAAKKELAQIREAFASAVAAAPSVLLLDDVDKFSNSDYGLCDTEEYVTIQSCIDESRGKGVFVVATVNDANKLPRSLLREGRFDHQIRLAAPVGHDALEITRHYLERAVFEWDRQVA